MDVPSGGRPLNTSMTSKVFLGSIASPSNFQHFRSHHFTSLIFLSFIFYFFFPGIFVCFSNIFSLLKFGFLLLFLVLILGVFVFSLQSVTKCLREVSVLLD